jgi:hypothetical protein
MTEKNFQDDVRELIARAESHTEHKERDNIHLWEILTALRGPDSDQFTLKNLTTARLRAIVFPNSNIGLINKDPLTEDELKERDRLLFGDLSDEESDALGVSGHFSSHFEDAMLTAKLLGYDVPDAELNFTHNIPLQEDEEEYEFNTDNDTPNEEEE